MFDDIIAKASELYRVPEAWIRAVIQTESSWNPEAYRAEPKINDASYGLMQLLSKTARGLGFTGTPEALYDPEINIDLGAKLLGQLRQKYGEDFRRIYSAYNSGRPDLWQTSQEVARNVQRALTNLEKYITETAQDVTATVTESPAAQSMITALLVMVLLWAWAGKRR